MHEKGHSDIPSPVNRKNHKMNNNLNLTSPYNMTFIPNQTEPKEPLNPWVELGWVHKFLEGFVHIVVYF